MSGHGAAPRARWSSVVLVTAMLVVAPGCGDRMDESLTPARFDYIAQATDPACPQREGQSLHALERSFDGVRYVVRAPANYEPAHRHPLLVVFAPARTSRHGTERMVGLTREATARGFVLAFVDAVRPGPAAAHKLADLPRRIAGEWCIDTQRIYLAGHSDGGSFASIIAVMAGAHQPIAGIVASAAGVQERDLDEHGCPTPRSVLIMHSTRDAIFPGFGESTSRWWGRCNGCDLDRPVRGRHGCLTWAACRASTWYCEGDEPHTRWPKRNAVVLDAVSGQLQ